MLLLIDAGNTRIKWALAEPADTASPGQWIAHGSVAQAQRQDLATDWKEFRVTRAIISNVAGAAVQSALDTLLHDALNLRARDIEWFASVPERAGLRNGYRDPGQLGCDRFASAIGARALYPGRALLVATCGTATTIDAISADGVFLGGMILPGLGLMASSLARSTAQLPQIADGLSIADPFADYTDAAIASGCLTAQAGAIERAAAALAHRQPLPRCLLSGGAAAWISPHLGLNHDRIDNLVLIGLQTVSAFPDTSSC